MKNLRFLTISALASVFSLIACGAPEGDGSRTNQAALVAAAPSASTHFREEAFARAGTCDQGATAEPAIGDGDDDAQTAAQQFMAGGAQRRCDSLSVRDAFATSSQVSPTRFDVVCKFHLPYGPNERFVSASADFSCNSPPHSP